MNATCFLGSSKRYPLKRKKERKKVARYSLYHKMSSVSSGPIRSVSSRKFHLTPLISDRRCVAKPHQTRSARGPPQRPPESSPLSPLLSLSPSPRPWFSLFHPPPSPRLTFPLPRLPDGLLPRQPTIAVRVVRQHQG